MCFIFDTFSVILRSTLTRLGFILPNVAQGKPDDNYWDFYRYQYVKLTLYDLDPAKRCCQRDPKADMPLEISRRKKGRREEVFGSPVGSDTTPEFHHSTLSVAIGVYRNPGDKDKTQTQLLSFAIKRVMLGYEKTPLCKMYCVHMCV